MTLLVQTPMFDPYAGQIRQFVLRTFPAIAGKTQPELLDALTDAIIASGKIRLGPKPTPEALVAIRKIIADSMALGRPINFVLPWGSEKPDGTSIDIAELSALKTVASLHDRIAQVYPPGAHFNLRIEDASAPHLFYKRAEKAAEEAALYTHDLMKLVDVLDMRRLITPRPESAKVTTSMFAATADKMVPAMQAHLRARTFDKSATIAARSLNELAGMGWKGVPDDDAIAFYLSAYAKLYEDETVEEHVHLLARYFAGAWARGQLGLRGESEEWQGLFLELSFAQPAPGSTFPRRVTYRTIPSSITSNHMTPWRAKGYLLMQGDGARPRLASFREELQLNECWMELSGNERTVKVRADYVVED